MVQMSDALIVTKAFQRVRQLQLMYGDDIPWHAIERGFEAEGDKVFIANKARGIFKPKQLSRGVLSIKTTVPRQGRVNIYADEAGGDGFFRYSLQRGDPMSQGNKYLWEALDDRSPFIYFYAVAPSVYKALWPCFITAIHPDQGYCEVVVGNAGATTPSPQVYESYQVPDPIERRYRVAESKQRIHQASFREQVLKAYDNKCAMTGLPVPTLLEAAHITPDRDPEGEARVTNGIALSRIHHRAFDANLLGIDADYRIHVSEKILSMGDGPLLEQGIKPFHTKLITLPAHPKNRPDRDRLDARFAQYLAEQ